MNADKKTRIVLLLLVAVGLSLGFAAGQKEQAQAQQTITFWTGYAERLPVYNAASADYMKEHPNVQIEIANFELRQAEQKYTIAVSAGTAPDMFATGHTVIQRLASEGYLDPVPEQHVAWMKENYEPVYLSAVTQDGKMYGVPEVQGFQLLFYNLDHYQEAGLTKPPATLDELMSHSKKLTQYDANGNVTRSGLSLRLSGGGQGVGEKFEIFLFANGPRVMQEISPRKYRPGFNSEAGYAALNFYLQALYQQKVDSYEVKHDAEAFVNGITSQFNRETYVIGEMRKRAPNVRYGITQVVGGPGGRATNLNVDGQLVTAKSRNRETAWDFARYMGQDRYSVMMMRDVGWTTSRKNVDYSSVYAQEPHFQQALDRPPGFELRLTHAAVSWVEVFTNFSSFLVNSYADPSLVDNKAKVMSLLEAAAQDAIKVLKANNEYAE
jgi:multiple sugar transport system substrate-binding protein